MTDLTRHHPAVVAAASAAARTAGKTTATTGTIDMNEVAAACLAAALPLLTENTPENLERLRRTPAGRALQAEGWARGAVTPRMQDGSEEPVGDNPYEQEAPR